MDRDDSLYRSASGRRLSRRRMRLTLLTAGLLAVLGGGTYAVAGHLGARDHEIVTAEPGGVAPIITPSSAFPSPPPAPPLSLPPPTPARSGARHSISPAAPESLPPPSVAPTPAAALENRIHRELSGAGSFSGQADSLPGPAGSPLGEVSERREDRPNGSLRIITARSDLTGLRELRWAGDAGRPIGPVSCTQNLRFTDDAKPSTQPNLLLCWRTSATRSVATLLADYGGRPSVADSVDIIEREWAQLG
jgi:hypothetical protein